MRCWRSSRSNTHPTSNSPPGCCARSKGGYGCASAPSRRPAGHPMAITTQPIGGAAEGWTLKQIGKEIPLTDSARDVLELAQRFAAQVGAATVEPVHVLCGIRFQPRNAARRALEGMGADMKQLETLRVAGSNAAPSSWKTIPIGATTRYMLNHAHREAEQLGHYRVDPLHMLLALLYKDSTATADVLEKAGVTF